MFRKTQTWLVIPLMLSAMALPAYGQEPDTTTGTGSVEIVLGWIDEALEMLWAAIGPEMEPIGEPSATGSGSGELPDFGPEMEPIGQDLPQIGPGMEPIGEDLPQIGPELEPIGQNLPSFGPGMEPIG